MSPVLVDTGAPVQNPNLNGQISLPLLSSFVASYLYSDSQFEQPPPPIQISMNPSNFGDLNSGFSNSSSNAQNLSSSGKPRPKPRLVKLRRQSNSQNFKSPADTCACPGFNPFQPVSPHAEQDVSKSSAFGFGGGGKESFVFGNGKSSFGGDSDSGKLNVENQVIEQMKNVRTGSGNVFGNNNLNASHRWTLVGCFNFPRFFFTFESLNFALISTF